MLTMNRNRWIIAFIMALTILVLFSPEMSAGWNPFGKDNKVSPEDNKIQEAYAKGRIVGFRAGFNSVVGPISDLQKRITGKMSR